MTIRSRRVPSSLDTSTPDQKPLKPTLMVTSFKGGCSKTALSSAIAERLAYADTRILLVSTDPQMDSLKRAGERSAGPNEIIEILKHNSGRLDILATTTQNVLQLIYANEDIAKQYDAFIIDTPPEARLGSLPNILYWIPNDGRDALQNNSTLLENRHSSSKMTLYAFGEEEIQKDLLKIAKRYPGVEVHYEVIPLDSRIKAAHRACQSPWQISPRRGKLVPFLDAATEAAQDLWNAMGRTGPLPAPPTPTSSHNVPPLEGW